MTDHQPSDIRKILGDIATESKEPSAAKPAAPSAERQPPGQSAKPASNEAKRHGAERAKAGDDQGEAPEIIAFEEPSGIDWSALKGRLIRMPVVGRVLRIGMAIIRLPKRLDAITDSISLLGDQNIDLETKLHSEISALQTKQQQLKLAMETGQSATVDDVSADLLRDYFHALAERFRGPYDQVKAKMALYMPILDAEPVDFKDYPAVDLACGRCEWSDLLREKGISCTGVDANPVVLRTGKANNLPVYCGDIFTYLESLADGTVGIVSGFHIIEHLPTAAKLQLFKEAQRVLVPGGLLILETPNSENPIVSSHYFYLDPSHLNPVPIPALEFMAEHFGFETATVLRHSPMAQPDLGGDDEGSAYLREWLSKEQDYGLVARKKGLEQKPEEMEGQEQEAAESQEQEGKA